VTLTLNQANVETLLGRLAAIIAPRQELPDEVKTFIVTALACFDTPSVAAAAVKEEFGLTVSRQAVQAYDPGKRAGKDLSEQWRALFAAAREKFIAETAAIGIAHKSVRLRMLDRMAASAEGKGNLVLTAALLEQAAKEDGGAFTNRRELSGPGGKPIEHRNMHDLSDAELTAIAASGRNRAPTKEESQN
jgi:hypothetical protein